MRRRLDPGTLSSLHFVSAPVISSIEPPTGVPPVVERCVHDIFQERAQADPEVQAVCAWDGELTYGELNDLSSHVASHLVHLGVGPEGRTAMLREVDVDCCGHAFRS